MKRIAGIILVNLYSFIRIAGIYPLLILTGQNEWGWAGLLFAGMVFTDITDGKLADLVNGKSAFGATFDLVCDTAMAVGAGITVVRTLPHGWYLLGAVVILAGIFQPMLMVKSLKGTLLFAIAQAMMVVLNIGTCLTIVMVYTFRAIGADVIYLWLVGGIVLMGLAWWRREDKIKGEWFGPLIAYYHSKKE